MKTILITIIGIFVLSSNHASAFWGSDTTPKKTGLDLAGGYDANTVASMRGVVSKPPARQDASERTEMTLTTAQGAFTVLLGPWSYWEKQNITITANQELTITGSRAIGKDGLNYIFAQKIDFQGNTPKTITLRSEKGVPLWSHNGSGATRNQGGGRNYGGGAMRGYGGNRR